MAPASQRDLKTELSNHGTLRHRGPRAESLSASAQAGPEKQQHVAQPEAQAACRGRGHPVLGTVPGRPLDSAPSLSRPGLLFILPGTQRL